MNLGRVTSYLEAWNDRDPDRVVAVLGDGATYTDPLTRAPLGGQALGRFLAETFAAFPDLHVESTAIAEASSRHVFLAWRRTGTMKGPLWDCAPTGASIAIEGVDILEATETGVRVQSYFDAAALAERAGLRWEVIEDDRDRPVQAGDAIRFVAEHGGLPGALSLTWVEQASAGEAARIRRLSRRIVSALQRQHGFLGAHMLSIGNREYTLSAWRSPGDVKLINRSRHSEAVRAAFSQNLGRASMISVWVPRDAPQIYRRCEACKAYVKLEGDGNGGGVCACGAAVEAPVWKL